MKATALSIACAAALGVAGQAMAHGPAVIPDMSIFISGASAQQLTLGKIANGLFAAGSIHVYYDTTTAGKDYRAYFGTVTGTGDVLLDGKKVLIHNRAKGGSVWGVNPVARAEAISRMNVVNDATCVATANVYPVVPQYNCTGTVNAIPDAGVSDVEPGMFVSINVAAGDSELNDAERARLTVASQNAVVFGVAQTDNLPVSLASLTRSQVNSMLTGTYQDWGSMDPALAGKPVVICRRVKGSGSQASFNWYFPNFPCSKGAQTPLTYTDSVPGGYTVVENSTSGAVKSCLNAAFNGGNVTQPDGSIVALPAGTLAIGVLSTESVPAVTDKWHFSKLDGIDATVLNATEGKYDYVVEQTFQTRNVNVCVGGAHVGAAAHLAPCHAGEINVSVPNATMAAFISQFVTRSGDPAYLSVLPGVASLPANYDPTLYPAGQVMKGTRQSNTCSAMQLFY